MEMTESGRFIGGPGDNGKRGMKMNNQAEVSGFYVRIVRSLPAKALTMCLGLAVAASLASPINAAVLLQVKELTDPGVVVRASGSLDLSGLGAPSRQRLDVDTAPLITPSAGYIGAGLPGLDGSNLFADVYRNVFANPIAAFGLGGPADHWSDSTVPGFFAIAMGDNALLLPAGYQSNSSIHAHTDYVGAPGFTLDSLGIDVGTYDFALVNGEHVTVEVAPIPLPATASLLAAGLVALAAAARATARRSPQIRTA